MQAMKDRFGRFSRIASDTAGSPAAFAAAFALIIAWAASGPAFNFTDTWQLIINTSTTILTFLMVFIIQNSQNRDSRALHAKLDELIKQQKAADNTLLGAEDLSDVELAALKARYERLAEHAAAAKNRRAASKAAAGKTAATSKAKTARASTPKSGTTTRTAAAKQSGRATTRTRGSGSPSRARS